MLWARVWLAITTFSQLLVNDRYVYLRRPHRYKVVYRDDTVVARYTWKSFWQMTDSIKHAYQHAIIVVEVPYTAQPRNVKVRRSHRNCDVGNNEMPALSQGQTSTHQRIINHKPIDVAWGQCYWLSSREAGLGAYVNSDELQGSVVEVSRD